MFVVGLTGGIGSGKTAVSDRFAQQGIDVVDADLVSRRVVEPGTQALWQIQRHFGDDILQADGQLDRASLRTQVFSNTDKKAWLEKLLHPLMGVEIFQQLEAAQSPYVLFVSPLLVESDQIALCDRVIVVDTPEAAQLDRATLRDNNTAEQVKKIMATQLNRRQRLESATDIIDNSGSLEELDHRIAELHRLFLQLSQEQVSQEQAADE